MGATPPPPHLGSLVQRELSAERLTEGLSARFPICLIKDQTSYPLRHFVTPPLCQKGEVSKGEPPPLTIRGGIVGGHGIPL